MRTKFHRLFGLTLTDFFTGTCYTVELEKDISIQQQFLDIVVVRKENSTCAPPPPEELPDGFEHLRAHNLISFKSVYEPLDKAAFAELNSHMIGYAKIMAGDDWARFCETELALFAICVRQPSTQAVAERLMPTDRPHVFRWDSNGYPVHCIVLGRASKIQRNAMWNLYSAEQSALNFGGGHYRWKDPKLSTIVKGIHDEYLPLGLNMPYTVEDYLQEQQEKLLEENPQLRQKILDETPHEELLRRLTPEERVDGLPPEQLVKGLTPEERVAGLSPEDRVGGLSPEERVWGLSPEELEALLTRMRSGQS